MFPKLAEKKIKSALKNDYFRKEFINLNTIIIPFSQFGNTTKPSYLYDGLEEISFKERHFLYQKIFLNEFVENNI